MKFTKEDLKRFRAESLPDKIQRSLSNISAWYARYDNKVVVMFSGGKDSTVLADICARWCKIINVPLYLLFVDTGLEYPEIREHVKYFAEWLRERYGIKVHLDITRPKMRFDEVIKKYGYPVISKSVADCIHGARLGQQSRINLLNGKDCDGSDRKSKYSKAKYKPLLYVDFEMSSMCCDVMKKRPAHEYTKKTGRMPIIATMTEESMLREKNWLKHGCNAFKAKHPQSAPMSFWTNQDVLLYIKTREIPISTVYGEIVFAENPEQTRLEEYGFTECGHDKLQTTGCDRTGCIFCGFGCHIEKKPRFKSLQQTHPRQYNYCIGGGEYNESGFWQPNKMGFGLGHVFDELNKIYGDDFINY